MQVEPSDRARFERLINWMKENGATINKMKIRWLGPEYRGVVASRDINKGDLLLSVPKNLVMNPDKYKESELVSKLY